MKIMCFRQSKILLFAVLCFTALYPGIARAQGGIRSIGYNTNTQLKVERPVKPRQNVSKSNAEPAYVLYRDVVRKNLWLEGLGEPISQEVADQLPCYFRLSMKNEKGHYQFVEAMRGSDLTSDHNVSTYIQDKRISSKADSLSGWDERFATIGQWLITSNLSGDRVVEERAYEATEKNANLIYAFQPVYNDSIHVTGSYTDSWGLPIDICESEDHYYGNVAYITLGRQGLDSIVDHLDARGHCRYNEYGVDQTRYKYDNRNRLTAVTSHNTVGDRVNDNRGICGTIYEYNDDDDTCTVSHIDKDMKPVMLVSSDPVESFIRAGIKFDKYGRRSDIVFLDEDYAPIDVDGMICKIKYLYPVGGKVTECLYLDGRDNPISKK